MSETSTETAATTEGQQEQQATPPWGKPEDFDPEKAWNLIQNVKAENKTLKTRPVLDEAAQQRLAEYDRLVEASQTDLERKSAEVTRWQTEAEKWRTTSVASQIQALATADFADPTDAVNALDPSKYLEVGGEINHTAIRADLAALLEAKPHYRRTDAASSSTTPRLPAPSPGQGTSGTSVSTDPAAQFGAVIAQALGK